MCVNTAVRFKLVSDFPLTPSASPECPRMGFPPLSQCCGQVLGHVPLLYSPPLAGLPLSPPADGTAPATTQCGQISQADLDQSLTLFNDENEEGFCLEVNLDVLA